MGKQNLTLMTDLYELTMMQGYFRNKDRNETVIFDAFYRNNPMDSGYSICAGLEQVIDYINNLHFEDDDIAYLRSLGIFGEDFLNYLRDFHFSGDIYAIPEGSIMFPREPMIKVIAPIMAALAPRVPASGPCARRRPNSIIPSPRAAKQTREVFVAIRL